MNAPRKPASPLPAWVYRYGLVLGIACASLAFTRATPLMTGELCTAHAGFEADCGKCHPHGGQSQDALCLECHGDIRTSSPAVIHKRIKERCAACHVEHRSRAYPLALSDPQAFDHDLTGFALARWHKGVACSGCHQAGQAYYRVKKECYDCHPGWGPETFDHARVTGIRLYSHLTLGCAECHPGNRYAAPPRCGSCHAGRVYRQGAQL